MPKFDFDKATPREIDEQVAIALGYRWMRNLVRRSDDDTHPIGHRFLVSPRMQDYEHLSGGRLLRIWSVAKGSEPTNAWAMHDVPRWAGSDGGAFAELWPFIAKAGWWLGNNSADTPIIFTEMNDGLKILASDAELSRCICKAFLTLKGVC